MEHEPEPVDEEGSGVCPRCERDFNLLEWLPRDLPYHILWLGIVMAWSGIWAFRVQRLQPAIVDKRLCFNCGYSLLHALVDATERGRCPECAQEFVMKQYKKPARGVAYHSDMCQSVY